MDQGTDSIRTLASLCAFGFLTCCNQKDDPNAAPAVQHSEPNVPIKPKTVSEPNDTGEQNDVLGLLKRKPEVIHNLRVRSEAIRAVNEIGERKQVEAIPVLLDQMFVITPFFVFNHEHFSESYPCSVSLIKIGQPAVPKVQGRFMIAKSGMEQLILLDVLIKVKGVRFTADWLEETQGIKLVPERRQRLAELRTWVLSQN